MASETNMTSRRPYLLRAIHEWICDNGLTSHLLVNANYPGVEVPWNFVEDGQIILNIAPGAVHGFVADNAGLYFSARFAGNPMDIVVPINAVLAVFARENGEGMVFDPVTPPEPPPEPDDGDDETASKAPVLRVVK